MKTRRLIPMLFSTPMVEAIGKGTKTQTRRICKHQYWSHMELIDVNKNGRLHKVDKNVSSPYGQPGDIIWVRETWNERSQRAMDMGFEKYYYKAGWEGCTDGGWKPNMYMPLRACRYFLEVKSVRVERLQDISEADAIAEGVSLHHRGEKYLNYLDQKSRVTQFIYNQRSAVGSFQTLWQSINGRDSWDANPWVWVVEFELIGVNEMMAYFQEILESYHPKLRGKVYSDLLACMVRLSEKKEATV